MMILKIILKELLIPRMKIFQKKKRLYFNLFYGMIWMAYGVYRLISNNNSPWLSYGFIILSTLYLIQFFYFLYKPILLIENNQILWNDLFRSKTFGLNEIVKVKKFAGDYTIYSDKDKIKINTQLFEKEPIEELNAVFDKLDLEN